MEHQNIDVQGVKQYTYHLFSTFGEKTHDKIIKAEKNPSFSHFEMRNRIENLNFRISKCEIQWSSGMWVVPNVAGCPLDSTKIVRDLVRRKYIRKIVVQTSSDTSRKVGR